MEKLKKLKEVNETISTMCLDLETRIFVEDIDVDENWVIEKYKPELAEDKTII